MSVLEDAFYGAGWDESEHPRNPGGTPIGGRFAPKVKDLGIMSYEVGGPDLEIEPDPELDAEILAKLEQFQRGHSSMFKPGVGLSSPYRRTDALMSMAREMYKATGGDIGSVVRAIESAEQWGTSWAFASDEWDAAWQLTGLEPPKRIKEDLERSTKEGARWIPRAYERPPLSETDLKAFKARQEWYQAQFRKAYPEGIWVYRGVTGKVPARKWVEAGGASYNERAQAEYDRTIRQERFGEHDWNRVYSDPIVGPAYSLSSWSESQGVAGQFAYGEKGRKHGVILRTPVQAEDIWMIPTIGGQGAIKFTDVSGEYVVVNPGHERRAEIVGYQ